MADARLIAIIIVGVLALSAFIGWMAWRFLKSAEKTLADPRRLRRGLILAGAFYACAAINGIVQVARGRMPLLSLLGLPIGLAFIWLYLRAASRIQVPPK